MILVSPDLTTHIATNFSLENCTVASDNWFWAALWARRVRSLAVVKPLSRHLISAGGAQTDIHPLTILVLDDDLILVGCDSNEVDGRPGAVHVFSPDWQLVRTIESHNGAPMFIRPYGLAADPSDPDICYVVDCVQAQPVRLSAGMGGLGWYSVQNPCTRLAAHRRGSFSLARALTACMLESRACIMDSM